MSDKLKMHTPNKADENFAKLAALFPNAVTETKDEHGEVVRAIDKDTLMQEISATVVEGADERYQFTWPDKKKSILLANAPINKTLRPCIDESVNFDTTENLYIEGDNLEVLKLLQETYLGKIKMIYIDPPYNTGNDSFVYDDNFEMSTSDFSTLSNQYDENGNLTFDMRDNNEGNGRFHTDWLNMIYPRIKVAKDLLTDDGVLFISIDDNEVENLKKVCNEIFGEAGFVTTLHIEMSATQGMKVKAAQNGNIVKNAEYILIYTKDGHKNIASTVLYDYRPDYDNHYTKFLDDNNEVKDLSQVYLEATGKKIKNAVSAYAEDADFRDFVEENLDKIFRYDKTTGFNPSDYELGKVYKINKNNRSYVIQRKPTGVEQMMFLRDSFGQCDNFKKSYGLRKIRGDWWKEFYLDMGNVSKEGDMVYANGKKPIRLIYQLCKMCLSENDIVLDFFSGSSTTAHAVMKLNSDLQINAKFIMVQLPDKIDYNNKDNVKNYDVDTLVTICDIGKERIRRAAKKIAEENPETKFDGGFRVLKCDSSNMKDVYYNPSEFELSLLDKMEDNIKEDRTPEDLLFQVMLDLGVLLSSKIEETTIAGKKVFNVADNFLIACFDKDVNDEVIKEIAQKKPYYFIMRDSSMANDSVATNFEQIFATFSPDTVRKVL